MGEDGKALNPHTHSSDGAGIPAVCDGAVGTMLIPALDSGERIEDVAVAQPDLVTELHQRYLEAGAERVHTASFLACARGGRARTTIYEAAAACALEACASHAGAEAVLTIGPLNSTAREVWGDLELALELGFTRVHCATLTNEACANAFLQAWNDVIVSARIPCDGVMSMSVNPSAHPRLPDWMARLQEAPQLAIGLNCCEGPTGLGEHAKQLADRWSRVHIAPSAGLPTHGGGADDPGYLQPAAWANAVMELISEVPVASVGGCCGTTPDHIVELHKIL